MGCATGGGELELDYTVVTRHGHPGLVRRRCEDGEDRASHAARAHPGEVEVAVGTP